MSLQRSHAGWVISGCKARARLHAEGRSIHAHAHAHIKVPGNVDGKENANDLRSTFCHVQGNAVHDRNTHGIHLCK
jgi:hypothetical protein